MEIQIPVPVAVIHGNHVGLVIIAQAEVAYLPFLEYILYFSYLGDLPVLTSQTAQPPLKGIGYQRLLLQKILLKEKGTLHEENVIYSVKGAEGTLLQGTYP